MNFNQIRKMAKEMGINTYRMKKVDIIRSIQGAENNLECFGTDRVFHCNEMSCLWRDDCLAFVNGNRMIRKQPAQVHGLA